MRRDFLGSILATGVERSKVGDIILLGETGAHILVAAELVEHFEQSLTQVVLLWNLLYLLKHVAKLNRGGPRWEERKVFSSPSLDL
jgi:RNA-binding protein YlmH